jgi:hypothetical protein
MQIFLSYASEDRALAATVSLALVGDGHQVFFDRDSLPPAGDYNARIRTAAERCDIFIFLISPDSVAPGSFALTELKLARERWPHPKGRVLPVRVRETPWEKVPPYLSAVTVLEPEGSAAAEVLFAVSKMAKEIVVEQTAPAEAQPGREETPPISAKATTSRDGNTTLYDRVKQQLLNNRFVVLLVILAAVVASGATLLKSFADLRSALTRQPEALTVTVQVANGGVCWDSGDEQLIKRSVVDFALNNRSNSAHIIKSAKIAPVWIRAFFWSGKMKSKGTFKVSLDEWYEYSIDVQYGERKNELQTLLNKGMAKVDDHGTWVRPEPISISQMIQDDMYDIKPDEPEKYRLTLGLSRSIDVLLGTVRLEFETDAGEKIISSPFDISVCELNPTKE